MYDILSVFALVLFNNNIAIIINNNEEKKSLIMRPNVAYWPTLNQCYNVSTFLMMHLPLFSRQQLSIAFILIHLHDFGNHNRCACCQQFQFCRVMTSIICAENAQNTP